MVDPLLSVGALLVSQLNPHAKLLYDLEQKIPLLMQPFGLHGVRMRPLDKGHELLLSIAGVVSSVLLLDSEVVHLPGGRGKLSHLLTSSSELCG